MMMALRPPMRSCLKYFGAKKKINIPIAISIMPVPLGLLCSLCAILYKYSEIEVATFFLPMSIINGPIFGPLSDARII